MRGIVLTITARFRMVRTWFSCTVYISSLFLVSQVNGEIRNFVLEVGARMIDPDGFERMAVLVNGTLPGPEIRANSGDELHILVRNKMSVTALTIHWHGLSMKGQPFMDGVNFVTQCPIPPLSEFTYVVPIAPYEVSTVLVNTAGSRCCVN